MRIVVKVGTSTLAYATGRLNIRHTEQLVKVLSDLKNEGHEVILVSSGAIGMGVGKLSLPTRPKDTTTKQACAAVGQCELMYTYDRLFTAYSHTVAQILLTADDVLDELADRYGPVPKSVQGLIDISLVRVVAAKLGIYEITQNRDTLILYSDKLDLATLKPLLKDMGRRLLVNASGKPYLSVRILPGEKPLDVMNAVFDKMAELERPQ